MNKKGTLVEMRDDLVQSVVSIKTSIPYKQVTVDDGDVSFTFEVPEHWMVETRNMGKNPMTEPEMREFFKTNYDSSSPWGDYIDYTSQQIDALSFQQLKNIFEERRGISTPGFPNASVSSSNAIWYNDQQSGQIDFYILTNADAREYFSYEIFKRRATPFNARDTSSEVRQQITVGGREAERREFNEELNEPGSTLVFVPLEEYSKVIVIMSPNVKKSDFLPQFDDLLQTIVLLDD